MDDNFEDDSGTVFRDTVMLALAGFVAMVLLLLPYVNPEAEKEAERSKTDPGNVIVEISWPPEMDADVDLWVKAPGDVPVGYSNKGTAVVNLLRDDLGQYGDLTNVNYEVVYSRGIVPGEWIVNVHAFRIDPDHPPPIRVQVVVSVKKPEDVRPLQALATDIVLERLGQELTALRFKLTEEGELVHGSVNALQYSIVLDAAGG